MNHIYEAPVKWNPTKPNPFSLEGKYGKEWSAFIYDEEVGNYSNVYNGTLVYVFRVNPERDIKYMRLFDYLNYETKHKRKVILSIPKYMDFNEMIKMYKQFLENNQSGFRDEDEKYLVHSTTKESWKSIKKMGAILSPNELKKQEINILEIGLKPMMEPEDYSNYIMLDVLDGCGELVVSSRHLGYVCTNSDVNYTPGVRLYFDAEAIINDGLGIRDGLHILKVKDKLPLEKYLLACVEAELFQKKDWTPSTFTEAANKYFLKNR